MADETHCLARLTSVVVVLIGILALTPTAWAADTSDDAELAQIRSDMERMESADVF